MKQKLTILTFAFLLVGTLSLLLGSQPAQARSFTAVEGGNPGISQILTDADGSDWELDPDDYQPMPLPTPEQPGQPPKPPQPPETPTTAPETPVSSGQMRPGGSSELDPSDYDPMPLPNPKQPTQPAKSRGVAGGGQLAVQR